MEIDTNRRRVINTDVMYSGIAPIDAVFKRR